MEEVNIDNLVADPSNPRRISKERFEALISDLKTYGDLGGIINNLTTGHLVGGNQRTEAFKRLGARPVITERYAQANSVGTVAIGYVILGDEKFNYREVQWDRIFERAANLAANNSGGENDRDMVAEQLYEISQANEALLANTGFDPKEINKLMKSIGVVEDEPASDDTDDDDKNEFVFSLTREQSELVTNALEHIRITKDIPSADTKSMNGSALYYMARKYMESEPQPDLAQQISEEFQPPAL